MIVNTFKHYYQRWTE